LKLVTETIVVRLLLLPDAKLVRTFSLSYHGRNVEYHSCSVWC